MQALNKTKAAFQGRSCQLTTSNLSFQDSTVIVVVNSQSGNPAWETGITVSLSHAANSGEALRVSDADAQPRQPNIIGLVKNRLSFSESVLRVTQSHAQPKQPIIWAVLNFYPTGGKIPTTNGGWDYQPTDTQNLGIELQICNSPPHFEVIEEFNKLVQFFNSSRNNLWRQASLTHELKFPVPATLLICSSKSSSKRMFFLVLFERSNLSLVFLSCIGTYRCTRINRNGTYRSVFTQPLNATKPGSGGTLTGPLTKPLVGVTNMAEQQHTQSRPKYQYRFLALCRADMAAKPCRLSIEAETELDARRVLAPHFILSLAARLPLAEVRHA